MCVNAQTITLTQRPFGSSAFVPQQDQLAIYKYDSELLNLSHLTIILPNITTATDTGLVFLRKSNIPTSDPAQNYICCVIINYRAENPEIILPSQSPPFYHFVSITKIPQLLEPKAGFYFTINKKAKTSGNPVFRSPFNGLIPVDKQYWLLYDNRNILMNDIIIKQDSLRIGVIDVNGDGIYNTKNIDAFIIAPYNSDTVYTLPLPNITCQKQATSNYFELSDRIYSIDKIASDGKSIRIKRKKKRGQNFAVVNLFDKLPASYVQSVDSITGEKTVNIITKYCLYDRPTFVFFQDLTSPVFYEKFLDSLQHFTEVHPNALSVIIISRYEDQSELDGFRKAHPSTWHYLAYDESLDSDFMLWLWPCGFLYDTNKKLISLVNIQMNISELIK